MSRLFLVFLVLCSIGNYGVQSSASSLDLFDTKKVSETSHKDTATHVYRESIRRLESRTDIVRMEAMPDNHTHEVVFAIQQLNMDKLLLVLEDVSNPASENYGNHMSGVSVAALTSNPSAAAAAVAYLNENGASVVSQSLYGEYVTATAPIAIWNEVLKAKFYAFYQTQIDGSIEKLVRSEHYHVPVELNDHILCVLNTIQIPLRTSSVRRVTHTPNSAPKIDLSNSHFESQGSPTGYIYPALLRKFYNAEKAYGSKEATQAAFGGNQDCFSPKSLLYFQRNVTNEPVQAALVRSNNYVSDDYKCDSGEGNLDIQYIIAMARGSPTTWWHKSGGLSGWLVEVANTLNPPLVLSISYGADELTVSKGEFDLFDQQAQKLGVRGVTVLVASGDDGVHSSAARYSSTNCGYNPDFPAGCPYVVAVGATSGPESGTPEVVCQSDTNNAITSGGGFSVYYPRPKWQEAQVAAYFASVTKSGQLPATGYSTTGRGFPDISMAGVNYLVHGPEKSSPNGQTQAMAGTSASCPVFGGMLSSVNAARIAAGKGPVGWVLPAIYAPGADFINDITVGNNKAAVGRVCPQGFYASPGWDPTTGLGSVNYGKMETYFMGLGGAERARPSYAPSAKPPSNPTEQPTAIIRVSAMPVAPTILPATAVPVTVTPTLSPSATPSQAPTLKPNAAPSILPSGAPSIISTASPSTASPSAMLTSAPTIATSAAPSFAAIVISTPAPSSEPSQSSTSALSAAPFSPPKSITESEEPTDFPTSAPVRTNSPIKAPKAVRPTKKPQFRQTKKPSKAPTMVPITTAPTQRPTYSYRIQLPSYAPNAVRAYRPTKEPTREPTKTSSRYTVPLYPATIRMHQDLDGITYAEVATDGFRTAIEKSVEDVIGYNGTSIISLAVTEGNGGRKLLSIVSVTYTIILISKLTSQEVLLQLQTSIDSGVFLTSLRLHSGYALGKPTATQLIVPAPSFEPTQAPTGVPQVSTGLSTVLLAAIIVGSVAGCFLIVFAAVSYGCYRSKDKKKKFPAVYDQMDSEGVDSIPDNIFDIIPECVADVCNPGKTSQGTVAAAKSQTQSQLLADSVLSA